MFTSRSATENPTTAFIHEVEVGKKIKKLKDSLHHLAMKEGVISKKEYLKKMQEVKDKLKGKKPTLQVS